MLSAQDLVFYVLSISRIDMQTYYFKNNEYTHAAVYVGFTIHLHPRRPSVQCLWCRLVLAYKNRDKSVSIHECTTGVPEI